jgi:hypothetical protein
MPSEQPNENMDKVLKAYAQKRRDESDQLELDTVTRNMLQAEVQRKLGKVPVPAQPARPRFAWWPQIIMGVACTAALALALIIWKFPAHEPTHEFAAKTVSSPAPAEVSVPVAQPETFGDKLRDKSESITASTPPQTGRSEDKAKFKSVPDLQKDSPPPSVTLDAEKRTVSEPTATLGYNSSDETTKKQAEAKAGESSDNAWKKNGVPQDAASFFNDSVVASDGTVNESLSKKENLSITQELPRQNLAKRTDGGGKSDLAAATPSAAPATTSGPAAAATPQVTASGTALGVDAITRQPSGTGGAQSKTFTVGGGVAALNDKLNSSVQQNMRFSQVDNRGQYRANVNSPALPKVLTTFGLERNGSNVIVRDADGSIYSGNVLVYTNISPTTQLNTYTANALANGNVAEDNYAFRVSGYNGRVRAKVIFTGNLTNAFVLTNQADFARQQDNFRNQSNGQNQIGTRNQQALQQNLLLNGRVQIGKQTEFDIQAEPTTR